MTAVPDYVPTLTIGKSDDPKKGGCLIQIANWLADPTLWTDQPVCVNGVLAAYGVRINDSVGAEQRRRLALLAPRLADTGPGNAGETNGKLVLWAHKHPCPPLMSALYGGNGGLILLAAGAPDYQVVDWYTALIDEYDRITGHTSPDLPRERWEQIKELVGQ